MKSLFRKIDKRRSVKNNSFDLKKNIDFVLSNNLVIKHIKNLKKLSLIDESEINFFYKKNIFCSNEFYKSENLSSKLKFSKSILLLPVGFFLIIYIFFKSSKFKTKTKKIDLLLDNIETNFELSFYENIISKFDKDKIVIRKTNNSVSHEFVNTVMLKKYSNYVISLKETLVCLKLLFESFIVSIKNNFNFVYLFLKFLNEYYYYRTFFKLISPKFILMHQHYASSNIKNYLLKKNDGILSTSIQKNIQTQGVNGFFIDCDILFTFSENTKINNEQSFSNIKKIFPIGSFFMEKKNYTQKNDLNEKFDIVYMGAHDLVNDNYDIFNLYESYKDDYNEQLNWLKKFSIENPQLKIGFKYHSTYNGSKYEKNIFKDSNIIFIDHRLNSYHLMQNSKIICSWNSTMIVEATSINKPSFFLDPNGRNLVFLEEMKNSDQLSIKSYDEFNKKMKFYLENENQTNYKDIFCKSSENYSTELVQILKSFDR